MAIAITHNPSDKQSSSECVACDCSPSAQNIKKYQEELAARHLDNVIPTAANVSETHLSQLNMTLYDFNRYQTLPSGNTRAIHMHDGRIDSIVADQNTQTQQKLSGKQALLSVRVQEEAKTVRIDNIQNDWILTTKHDLLSSDKVPSQPQTGIQRYFAPDTITYAGQLLGLRAKPLKNYLDTIDKYHEINPMEKPDYNGSRFARTISQFDFAASAILFARETGLSAEEIPDQIRQTAVLGMQNWLYSALMASEYGNAHQAALQIINAYHCSQFLEIPLSLETDEYTVTGLDDAVTLVQTNILKQKNLLFKPEQRALIRSNATSFVEEIQQATGLQVPVLPEIALFPESADTNSKKI